MSLHVVTPFISLAFAGFTIFLMVDGHRRFRALDADSASQMQRTHALMMTLLVVFLLLLLAAAGISTAQQFPSVAAQLGMRQKSDE